MSADPLAEAAAMTALIGAAFPIVSDHQLALIERLGLLDSDPAVSHPIARPDAFGIGSSGAIEYRFVSASEADRPRPALLVLAAERLATTIGRSS